MQLHVKSKSRLTHENKVAPTVKKRYCSVQPPLCLGYKVPLGSEGRDVNICSIDETSPPLRSKHIPMVNGIKENEPEKKAILLSISIELESVVTFQDVN